jgi:hypothetical protein
VIVGQTIKGLLFDMFPSNIVLNSATVSVQEYFNAQRYTSYGKKLAFMNHKYFKFTVTKQNSSLISFAAISARMCFLDLAEE